MNVVGLYAATCRSALRLRPDDPSSWADLPTLLPILRQALGCCVCSEILNVPMAPMDTICQHHVCKDCIGGRMKVKPSCSWCKEWDDFVEKPQVRSLIQCFKGLCEYLRNSSIAAQLAQTNNGGKNTLMTLVQEGASIPDVFVPPQPDLNLGFIPMLPTAPVQTVKLENDVSNRSPHRSPTRQSVSELRKGVKAEEDPKVKAHNKQHSPGKSQKQTEKTVHEDDTSQSSSCKEDIDVTGSMSPRRTEPERRHSERSPRKKEKVEHISEDKSKHTAKKVEKVEKTESQASQSASDVKDSPKKKTVKDEDVTSPSKPENEKPVKHVTRADRNIFQTVAAEHDYNVVAWAVGPESPRTRTRQTSGHRSGSDEASLPGSPLAKRQRLGSGPEALHIPIVSLDAAAPLLQSMSPSHLTRVLSPQAQTQSSLLQQQSTTDHDPKLSWTVKPRKRVNKKPKPKGCRCGLATPNPGKLTCCGQRCPCYAAFKGCCPDCRCRGCRNPRKLVPDLPAPPPPPELFPPEATLTLTGVNSESEDSEIEIDV